MSSQLRDYRLNRILQRVHPRGPTSPIDYTFDNRDPLRKMSLPARLSTSTADTTADSWNADIPLAKVIEKPIYRL